MSTERPAWHNSPLADAAFYHFSWLPPLIVCLVIRQYFDMHSTETIFIFWTSISAVHRWYTIPYAYLDKEVFTPSRKALLGFPVFLLALIVALPWVVAAVVEWTGLRALVIVGGVIAFRGVWDSWHSLMQKYGILRIYNGRGKIENGPEVARWTDFLMLIAWAPLIGACHASDGDGRLGIARNLTVGPLSVPAFVDWAVENQALLIAISAVPVAASIGLWLWHEHRTFRFQNRARLSLLTGQTLMMLTVLVVDPLTAATVGAVNHAVEYTAFLWHTQRKRYAASPGRETLLARITRNPWLAVALYLLIPVSLRYFDLASRKSALVLFAGCTLSVWCALALSCESFAHYYIDGVIWKYKKPAYRASLG